VDDEFFHRSYWAEVGFLARTNRSMPARSGQISMSCQ
jgi:hypothetical protein